MVIKSDVHTHTDFCDGRDSMQLMAEYAATNGLDTLGLCFHSYTEFDKSYCIRDYYGYMQEFYRLKQLYTGKLTLLNGVELDLYGQRPSVCDYVIGSVHYLKEGNRYLAIDTSEDLFNDMLRRVYGGNAMAMVKRYYEEVAELPDAVNPDIYGHFDLISRYNAGGKYFDESSPEYIRCVLKAVKALPERSIIEINGGRAFKGEGDIYPSERIIEILNDRGMRFMLSSDAHCKEALCHNFDRTLSRLKSLGVRSVATYIGGNLVDVDI